MKKASILAFQFADNFGAVLQIYGLQKVLEKKGVEVDVINYTPKKLEEPYTIGIDIRHSIKNEGIMRTLKILGRKFFEVRRNYYRRNKFNEFRKNMLNIRSNRINNHDDLHTKLPDYDYYFVGSDQVWNPMFFKHAGLAYFLDFASENSKKISYAASIAQDFDSHYESVFKKELQRFDHISVREESARLRLLEFNNLQITTTLDPTLLLNKEEWLPMVEDTEMLEPFILVYDLQKSETIVKFSNKLAEQTGLKIISYSGDKEYMNSLFSFSKMGPREFIKLYDEAQYVITSSFHGTAFSIIFEKEFFTVPHSTRGSRMIDLLSSLELSERIITEVPENLNLSMKIDYIKPLEKLDKLRKESLSFINQSIDG